MVSYKFPPMQGREAIICHSKEKGSDSLDRIVVPRKRGRPKKNKSRPHNRLINRRNRMFDEDPGLSRVLWEEVGLEAPPYPDYPDKH